MRIVIAVAIVIAVSACDQVLGLGQAQLADAGPLVDAKFFDVALDARLPSVVPYIAPGDFDGDGEPNATDPCPLVAFENPTDSDGDGLPDVCDPNINGTRPDCIVLFEGFGDPNEQPLDPRWISSGSWSLTSSCPNSGRGYCSPSSGVSFVYFDQAEEAGLVEAAMVVSVNANTNDDEFQVLDRADGGADLSGRACGLFRTLGATDLRVADLGASGTIVYDATTGQGMNPGTPVTVDWNWYATRTCELAIGGTSHSAGVPAAIPPVIGPDVGVRVVNLGVNLQYVIAYGSRCPPS